MEPVRVVCGTVAALDRTNVDTDQIIPKQFLKRIERTGFGQFLFYDWRQQDDFPLNRPEFAGAPILVAGPNFGCGSSREHAPQALYRWGIRAVVGESFSEIFFGNSAIIGLPCVKASSEDMRALMEQVDADPQTTVTVDLNASLVQAGNVSCAVSIPKKVRDALITGAWDTTGLLLDRYEEVDATAAKLPYVTGF